MVKTALGKGMKDLLAKNVDVAEKKEPEKDKKKAKEELDVNISRYKAQGYDVSLLNSLKKKDTEAILKGIEDYRDKVRILNSVQTMIRALEGYGYSKEIESINERLKNPKKARQLIQEAEELKYRAKTEHATEEKEVSSPRRKLAESLKEKAQMFRGDEVKTEDLDIDDDKLDGMLDDLSDIESAFSLEADDDPLLSKIADWEEMGYFVNGLKTSLTEDRTKAEEEAKQFEKDVERMEKVKERFNEMNMSGFQQEKSEIELKLQYPHLAQDVENQLDKISKIIEEAEEEIDGKVLVSEEKKDAPPSDEEKGEMEESPEPEEESIPKEKEESPKEEEEEEPHQKAEKEEKVEDAYPGKSAEDLMEMAKNSYRDGNMEESLILFKEVLKKDPESSKARFMIRRISSKLS